MKRLPWFLVLGLTCGTGVADQPACASDPELDRHAYAQFARTTHGDPARGRAVFVNPATAGCARCHRVRGEGSDLGPDLSEIGGKFRREHLIESVLEPSREIVEGYRTTLLATADGRMLTGVIKGENDRSLTLVDSGARAHVVPVADVVERHASNVSIMPDGLAQTLSRQQFADLVAYLESLRSEADDRVTLPRGFSLSRVASGISGATAMAVAPDSRVFVCEQTGALRLVKNGVLRPEPVLTLDVDRQWERGLIGVALDPDFASNGFVYVNHVLARPFPHHRVSRFQVVGDIADRASERVLIEGDDQRTLGGSVPAGHQGGALHFGGDGMLYIAIGDQTAGQPAQRLDTFQGKLLRIHPDGRLPEDNPFLKEARGKYRAIWARGLRNPFSFAVQPKTGRIFLNDVGQDAWEEINEGVAGANYGWPAVEGPTSGLDFRAPIHAYRASSIAGGAFCPDRPGTAFPTEFHGKYFFMDFIKGWVKVLDPAHPAEVATFASGLARPVDLAFAPDGNLDVLVRDAWVIDETFTSGTGALFQIRFTPE